jgi:hypothetical protein
MCAIASIGIAMEDYAHHLRLPLQPEITVSGTHSTEVIVPETVWDAIEAWRCIKDDDLAYMVGKNIQKRIDEGYNA